MPYKDRAERYMKDMEEEFSNFIYAYFRMMSYDSKIPKMLDKGYQANEFDETFIQDIEARQAVVRQKVRATLLRASENIERRWDPPKE